MADDFGGFEDEEAETNDGFGSDESESGGDDFGFGFIEVDEEEEGFGIEFVSEEEFQKEQEQWQEEDRKAAEMLKWEEAQLAKEMETNPTTTTTPSATTTQFESPMPAIEVETNAAVSPQKQVEILGQKKGWCDYKLIGKGGATIMRKNKWKPIWVELSREGVMVLKKMVNDTEPLTTIEVPYAKLMEDPGGSKMRFAMGLKSQTYYFEAKSENEVELWMLNIEKAKKRNRRRSAYGRQTNQSTLMVF
eukprot:m.216380 g.216380  ORF g.216380 m.216380 type:complete len:248 (-) comp33207_c3_seq2:113-856(-)